MKAITFASVVLICLAASVRAQITITPAHPAGVYAVGEKVSWTLTERDPADTAQYNFTLLRNGITDVNTENPADIAAAQKALQQLVSSANLKFDTNEYQHLADGSLWLHQAWSGDMAATPSYAPQGVKPSAFAYWWPQDGKGPIDNDTMAVLKGSKNPVLAHLFLNHVLDVQQAFSNYSYIFYQQPLNAMTPRAVVKKGLVASNLQNTLIEEAQFKAGYVQGPLSEAGQTLWENAWAAVQSS